MKYVDINWKKISIIGSIVLIVYYIAVGTSLIKIDLDSLSSDRIVSISMDVLGLFISTLLYYSCCFEKSNIDQETNVFMLLLFTECSLLTCDILSWLWDGYQKMRLLVSFTNGMIYVIFLLMLIFYQIYVHRSLNIRYKDNIIVNRCFIVHTVICFSLLVLNLKYHFYYSISSTGLYLRSDYFYVSTLIAMVLFGYIILTIAIQKVNFKVKIKLISYSLLPIFFNFFQNFTFGYSLLEIAVLASLILIYVNVHLQRGVDILVKNEELMIKEREIQQYQTDIMITCIQPHFLFNSLGAIEMLIKLDQDQAAEATNKFSKYLRRNLESISNKEPIPFSKELEHVMNYMYLEIIRFGDVKFNFDEIENSDFLIPSLTVQPLVENAIKHGIMGIEEGGQVIIKEYETKKDHVIIVEDDGIGFDVERYKQDGKTHIGIENVRYRLETIVNGTLEIESEINKGTRVIITIPK